MFICIEQHLDEIMDLRKQMESMETQLKAEKTFIDVSLLQIHWI